MADIKAQISGSIDQDFRCFRRQACEYKRFYKALPIYQCSDEVDNSG
jgi:hypothetical protein